MFVTDNFKELAQHTQRVCLAIGVFDGVHRGHEKVIGQAVEDARACGGDSVVLTFDPHPARVLRSGKAPPLLTSTPHKLELIETLHVKACLVVPFTREFADMPPVAFLDSLCQKVNGLQEICVGFQWCFGKDRSGTVALIKQVGQQRGFDVKEIPPVTVGGEVVSSTLIRRSVAAGELARAAEMLGRPFSILGTVEQGDARGRELGFPTANLDPHNEVLPPDGVYAVRARLFEQGKFSATNARLLHGVLNLGLRPTFQSPHPKRVLEVHLFGFAENLYGKDIEVIFGPKIRNEQKFESVDALRQQIAADCAAARAILSATNK